MSTRRGREHLAHPYEPKLTLHYDGHSIRLKKFQAEKGKDADELVIHCHSQVKKYLDALPVKVVFSCPARRAMGSKWFLETISGAPRQKQINSPAPSRITPYERDRDGRGLANFDDHIFAADGARCFRA